MIEIEDVSEAHLFYGIGLMIRHPSIDPKIITTELRLIPHRYWRAGSRCSTPIGTPLAGIVFGLGGWTVKEKKHFLKVYVNYLLG